MLFTNKSSNRWIYIFLAGDFFKRANFLTTLGLLRRKPFLKISLPSYFVKKKKKHSKFAGTFLERLPTSPPFPQYVQGLSESCSSLFLVVI